MTRDHTIKTTDNEKKKQKEKKKFVITYARTETPIYIIILWIDTEECSNQKDNFIETKQRKQMEKMEANLFVT